MTPTNSLRPARASFRAILFALAIMTATEAVAQSSKKTDDGLHYEVGVSFYHPLKYFNMFSGFGTGIDAAVLHPLIDKLSVGARVNYGYFFGRSTDPAFSSGNGDHFKASGLYDFFAEANYQLPSNVVAGVDLGYGFISFNGASDGSFAQKIFVGYQLDGWSYPLIIAAFYEQTDYHKNAGVRVTVKL